MSVQKYLTIICFNLTSLVAYAQSTYIPYNKDYYYMLDRYEILTGEVSPNFHTSFKPYTRKDVSNFAENLIKDSTIQFSERDKFNLNYLANDNYEFSLDTSRSNRKPFLKYFYKKQNAFFNHRSKDFEIIVNPVIYATGGKELVNGQLNSSTMFLNTRGIELRGMIAKRIGFYTLITDNQALFPAYAMNEINKVNMPGTGYNNYPSVPEEAFLTQVIGSQTKLYKYFLGNQIGVDFSTARGYITFDIIKNIVNVQFGQDKNFIGNGYRSLLLSDNSSPYLFGKRTTKVWKLNYTLLYAKLTYDATQLGNSSYPQKFYAAHFLSMNLGKKLTVGLFEGIMSTNGNNLDFFNPIIFYKSIENQMGSPDKSIIGLDLKYNVAKQLSLYGQLIINEFVLNEVTSNKGWWGNKYGFQLGLKYVNVFNIKNLDLQLETNVVRPYVYSAGDSSNSYTNYNTPLAHPLGANFEEFLGILRYQPINRLMLQGKAFYILQGLDIPGGNDYGSNPLKSYNDRPSDYGNFLLQGANTKTILLEFMASYMLKHNFFLEFMQLVRVEKSTYDPYNLNEFYTSIGFRWNIQPRLQEF